MNYKEVLRLSKKPKLTKADTLTIQLWEAILEKAIKEAEHGDKINVGELMGGILDEIATSVNALKVWFRQYINELPITEESKRRAIEILEKVIILKTKEDYERPAKYISIMTKEES